ncbi:short chain dehydrogenase [compost metagenome]
MYGSCSRTRHINESSYLYVGVSAYLTRTHLKLVEHGLLADPAKMAQAIIVAADSDKAPLRLTLVGDAYDLVHKSLSSRIAALEEQKEVAYSTDFINQ